MKLLYEEKPTITTPGQGVDILLQAEREAEELEAKLKAANAYIRELETVTLPGVFADADQVEATSTSGAKAKFGNTYEGSLPKVDEKSPPDQQAIQEQKRAAAIALAVWYGWGPLIRTKVTAEWDKGDREKALRLFEELRKDNSVILKMDESIHASTLKSQVKNRIQAGEACDYEALGITVLPAVKLTKRPKG